MPIEVLPSSLERLGSAAGTEVIKRLEKSLLGERKKRGNPELVAYEPEHKEGNFFTEGMKSIGRRFRDTIDGTFDLLVTRPVNWVREKINQHPILTTALVLGLAAAWYYSPVLGLGLSGMVEAGRRKLGELLEKHFKISPDRVNKLLDTHLRGKLLEGEDKLPANATEDQRLIHHLKRESKGLELDLEQSNTEYKPSDMTDKMFFDLLTIRREELRQLVLLLEQHGKDPEILKQCAKLNALYDKAWDADLQVHTSEKELLRQKDQPQQDNDQLETLDRQLSEAKEDKKNWMRQLRDETKALLDKPLQALDSKKYAKEETKLDSQLDEKQREYLRGLAESNDPDAFFETYAASQNLYKELCLKILKMPRQQRDLNLNKLEQSVGLYQSIKNGEFQKAFTEKVQLQTEKVLREQSERFTGLRGLIQSGVDKLADFSISVVETLCGNDDSISKYVLISLAKTAKRLAKPVTYDPELVKEVEKSTLAQLQTIAKSFDLKPVQELHEACQRLRAFPQDDLPEAEEKAFMDKFNAFSKETTKMFRRAIDLEKEMASDAYIYSHGEENSEFPADSQFRAKFLQYKGKDLLRMAQVFSPFGVFLPEKVALKPKDKRDPKDSINADVIYLESGFNQGFWKDHEILSLLTQSGLAIGGREAGILGARLGYMALRNALKPSGVGFLLPKGDKFAARFNPAARIAFNVWLGIEVGAFAKEKMEEAYDNEVITLLDEYIQVKQDLEFYDSDTKEKQSQIREEIDLLKSELERGEMYAPGYPPVRKLTAEDKSRHEQSISDNLKLFTSLEKPALQTKIKDLEKQIRIKILVSEISKRRSLFQNVGVDLSKDDVGTWDRFMLQNIGDDGESLDLNPFLGNMKNEGTLQEAYIAANKKLNLLGLQLFVLSN